jgi:hypothetical protein
MGLMKNLTAYLYAHPDIACLMDVVVIDLPPAYGMLLSRKRSAGVGGSFQMDLSYALIPNAEGEFVILNRDHCCFDAYLLCCLDAYLLTNHHLLGIFISYLEAFILHLDLDGALGLMRVLHTWFTHWLTPRCMPIN